MSSKRARADAPAPPYAPLWCKTNFSFLEGASHPDELVKAAQALGVTELAITDRDGTYGVVRAFAAAKDTGVRLIYGAQVTVAAYGQTLADSPTSTEIGGRGPGWTAPDAMTPTVAPKRGRARRPVSRKPVTGTIPTIAASAAQTAPAAPAASSRIVLLASDRAGWANLTRLLTAGRRRCDKGDSLVSWAEVCAHAGGLVALCADALAAPAAPPPALVADLRDAYGDRLYALLARHEHGDETPGELRLRERAAAAGLPIVGATEVLYHHESRRPLQDVLTCIRHGVTLATAGRRIHPNDEHQLRRPASFAKLFADVPGAAARTLEVAARCRFSLGELRYRYPSERLPDGSTSMSYLRRLVADGAASRWPTGVRPEERATLARELGVIEQLDYAGYFLTMFEIVQYCNRRGILCQGRGSAANSAVCYCLGITGVDPVHHRLLFERFLSLERQEPPDIDLDIEHERREEVIQHVYNVYGRDHAAMVCNINRYRPRSAIRDVGKALGLPETLVDRAAKQVTSYGAVDHGSVAGLGATAAGASAAGANQSSLELLELLAGQLVGFPRHLSIHPGGFLLGHEPVHDIVPIENATMPGRTVIQWDKDDLEELGLFKVDLLALGALYQLHLAFDLLRAHGGPALTIATVPHDDKATYELIQTADTIGVFQIESRAQMAMLPRLRPKKFYDLVIEVSLVRPGPIAGGMVHPYLRRRDELEEVIYPHSSLEKVLARTLGVPLFQEQVMELAIVAGGYTPGEADRLRRDMASWRRNGRMENHRRRLIDAMVAKGIAEEFAERVFKQILGFGEYGFPESHATSFALLAYVTSFIRTHHFAVFTCALLNAQPMGFYSPSTIVGDAQRHALDVRPIAIEASEWDCTLEPPGPGDDAGGHPFALRMGMRWVRGLSQADCERIVAARRERPFASVEDFVRRARVSERAHAALAEAGALGAFAAERRDALWQVAGWIRRQDEPLALGGDDQDDVRFASLSLAEEITWDHETAAHSTRGHPLAPMRDELTAHGWPAARGVRTLTDGDMTDFVGIVICRQHPTTAKGVLFMTLEDETGFVNVVVWRKVFEQFEEVIRSTSLLGVTGYIQKQETVIHLVALTLWQPELSRPVIEVDSYDFK